MKLEPILMEDYFDPGFKTKPAVHIGSQTVPFFLNNIQEQAWEGCALAAANNADIAIVRNFDPAYLKYWGNLMDQPYVINIKDKKNAGKYLTDVILEREKVINLIKNKMNPSSKLMVFMCTDLEQKLADKLGIPLHGSPKISSKYGIKSGIRKLAKELNIPMAPGFICTTLREVEEAINNLSKSFDTIVIKHDQSLSGYFSKKLEVKKIMSIKIHLDEISKGKFVEGKDIVVVEGWLNSQISLCAHIEILKNQNPIICGAWQQIIHSDGISFMGAGPLRLTSNAMKSLIKQINKLALGLKSKGAVGSYGPDFLIYNNECLLIELNARVPYTAFPLEIIKQIKGKIGAGFLSKHIRLSSKATFRTIQKLLQDKGLLISKKDSYAKGIVPYNVGLLPWNLFDVLVMAPSWEETLQITSKVDSLFQQE